MSSLSATDVLQTFQVTHEAPQSECWVAVEYMMVKGKGLTEIPLFFSEFPASSSREDFFTYEFKVPEGESVHFHFPTTALKTNRSKQGKELRSFVLPALPSMIRLELDDDVRQASFQVTLIDLSVAGVFLVIGLLIYRYRKKLVYG